MTLETERLVLRPISVRDLDHVLELHSQPAIAEYVGSLTAEEARERLELSERNWRELGYDRMAVLERSTGRFAGRVGLRHWPQFNEIEAGWAIRQELWGRGYATEAAGAVIDWGLRTLPVSYVTAMIRPDNSRSLAVARRLRMSRIRDDALFGIPVIVHAIDRGRWGLPDDSEELERLVAQVATWAKDQTGLVAVALVGSQARRSARPDSDVDLVLLTRDPDHLGRGEEWAERLAGSPVQATAHRGLLIEQRVRLPSGLELDVAVGSPRWAAVDPVEEGTARVAREGLRIVHDPEGLLARLKEAVS